MVTGTDTVIARWRLGEVERGTQTSVVTIHRVGLEAIVKCK
jgi:hypothetical protein